MRPYASRRARREFYRIHTIIYSAEAFPAGARRTLRPRRAQPAGGQDRGIAAPSLQATTPEYLKELAVYGKPPRARPKRILLDRYIAWEIAWAQIYGHGSSDCAASTAQHSPEQEPDEAKTKKRPCVNRRPASQSCMFRAVLSRTLRRCGTQEQSSLYSISGLSGIFPNTTEFGMPRTPVAVSFSTRQN